MRLTAARLLSLLALVTGLPTSAQESPTPVVVRAARMLDVKSGAYVQNPMLVIEGGRISAVGPGLAVPEGARVTGYADVALRDAIRQGLVEGPRMLVATQGIAAVGQYHPFGVPTLGIVETLAEQAPTESARQSRLKSLEPLRQVVRQAQALGVKIVSGYDASSPITQWQNAREIVALQRAGLPALEAIRAATSRAAELLGLTEHVGSLGEGPLWGPHRRLRGSARRRDRAAARALRHEGRRGHPRRAPSDQRTGRAVGASSTFTHRKRPGMIHAPHEEQEE